MAKEFDLSKKIICGKHANYKECTWFFKENDVKAFIRLLKEELFGSPYKFSDNEAIDMIDKLAGEKLI